jgi:FlaA1/EpsC-like NDP-sugar epimerase
MRTIERDSTILVTGGCGSIGSQIVRRALKAKQVRAFDNRESALADMMIELKDHDNIRYLMGDVRDRRRLQLSMEGVDVVYHAAAYKHVHMCEYNPFEAVSTNVNGTQNVIDAALYSSAKKVINISTDKVTNAVSTMGATKLLAERLIAAAQYRKTNTIFCSVRFGNVLGSNGSFINVFKKQLKANLPITLTDRRMRRFIMTINQAVDLIFKASDEMKGGEVFILKMPVVRMEDIISVMKEKYGVEVDVIGIRKGERLYEELLTRDESFNVEEKDEFYIIKPGVGKTPCSRQYSSKYVEPMSWEEIEKDICCFF